jgi:hypothetical protein
MGVNSFFSELQASIIVFLNRSYRPIKGNQLKEVLEYSGDDFESILKELATKNIIIYNSEASNY